jgi:hypothetical protein
MLFWLQFMPSPPFRRRMPLPSQAAALSITNVIMIGLAMVLSIFTTHSVYPADRGALGAAVGGPAVDGLGVGGAGVGGVGQLPSPPDGES